MTGVYGQCLGEWAGTPGHPYKKCREIGGMCGRIFKFCRRIF